MRGLFKILPNHRLRSLLPILIALFTGGLYLKTLYPSLAMGDSGELLSAGYSLGLPHSPSFPLYSLILKPGLLLPLGNIAWRGNLLAAAFSAGSAALFFLLLRRFGGTALALGGSLIFAGLTGTWQQAVHAEVYSLAFCLILFIFLLYFQLKTTKGFYLLFFLWGLLGANHSLMAASLAAFFLALIFRLKNPKHWLQALTFCLLALGLYCYLPLRSTTSPPINWGQPTRGANFLEALTRKSSLGTFFTYNSRTVLPRLQAIGQIFYRQLGLLLPLALGGLLFLPWSILALVGVTIFLNLISEFSHLYFSAFHPDILAYYGITNIFLVIGLVLLGQRLFKRSYLKFILAILWGGYFLITGFMLVSQRQNQWAYYYGRDLLHSLPANSILTASEIDVAFPLAYLKIIEGRRPDLLVRETNIFPPLPAPTEVLNWQAKRQAVFISFVESLGADNLPASSRLIPHGLVYQLSSPAPHPAPLWRDLHFPRLSNPPADFLTTWLAADYAILAGEACFNDKQIPAALNYWRDASTIANADKETHNLLGLLYLQRGYPQLAQTEYRAALKLDPAYVNAYTNLGNWYLANADIEQAATNFKLALQNAPSDPDSLNNLGNLYLRSPTTQAEGVALLEKCLRINENYLNAYYNLGNFYYQSQNWELATAYFTRLLNKEPTNVRALNALGGVFWQTGQLERAVPLFERVLEIAPDYALTMYNLINLYQNSNQPEKARLLLQRLSQLAEPLPATPLKLKNWAAAELARQTHEK